MYIYHINAHKYLKICHYKLETAEPANKALNLEI